MKPVVFITGGGTGGHVFPGLAVADALVGLADVDVVFGGSPRGIENEFVPRAGYVLETLDVRPMKGGGFSRAAKGGFKAALATVRALAILKRLAPSALLSIGGYAAGPFALAAVLLRIPITILEPNGLLGFTNRVMAPLAERAYLAWPDLESRVKRGTARVVGVPLRNHFEPSEYEPRGPQKRVLVLGGSQGAEALNDRVPRALAGMDNVEIVHQAGPGKESEVRALYTQLSFKNAVILPFIDDMPKRLADADLVIARSGAGTVAEIAAIGRASILIPFPFAADDHQATNAHALERTRGCICLLQKEATVERLRREIVALLENDLGRMEMATAARAVGRPKAAYDVAGDILALANIPLRLSNQQNGKSSLSQLAGHRV